MHKYMPFILLTFVIMTATVALTLSLSENSIGEVTYERSCKSLPQFASAQQNVMNCLDAVRGGCPEVEKGMRPWKQYGFVIDNIATCCCVKIKSDDKPFRWGQSLYR